MLELQSSKEATLNQLDVSLLNWRRSTDEHALDRATTKGGLWVDHIQMKRICCGSGRKRCNVEFQRGEEKEEKRFLRSGHAHMTAHVG